MLKKIWIKIWNITASVLAFLFLFFGTIFTYYYANGYRFNPINGQVKQTGVVTIETLPTKAEVVVNNKNLGKSPKITAVDIGSATVKISKDSYITWEKTVPVIPEKSTNLKPNLFLTTLQAESIFSSNSKIIAQTTDTLNNNIFITTLQDGKYKINKYTAKRAFWDINDNPQTLYETPSTNIKKFDVTFSPKFDWVLIAKTQKTKSYEIVKLSNPTETIKLEELNQFQEYKFTWAQDSNYLILESDQDIIAYKYSDGTKYLLLKKNKKDLIWTTDTEGSFYYLDKKVDKDYITANIVQMTLQGSSKKTILENIYFINNNRYIEDIRKQELQYQLITNAKENTQFAGDILSFKVYPKATGVVFFSQYATYWFNQLENKYALISPWPISIINVSPDNNKLIYFDQKTNNYSVFTFNKIEEDPLTILGSKKIINGDKISNISWSNDSQNIFYVNNSELFTTEYDGNNTIKITQSTGAYTISENLEYLFQTKSTDTSFEILRYRLH